MSQPQALHSMLPAGAGTPQRGHFVSCGLSWRRKRATSLISHLTGDPPLIVWTAVSRSMGTDPHSTRRSDSAARLSGGRTSQAAGSYALDAHRPLWVRAPAVADL